ncbi:hypothetical protein H4S06_000014 [Coemansia sp. BCRC 34490]|nr:hypothetical protein H4S06_000014 [Coemansia sp. BCRC 34490]
MAMGKPLLRRLRLHSRSRRRRQTHVVAASIVVVQVACIAYADTRETTTQWIRWWLILPPLAARALIPRIILASSADSTVIGKHRQGQGQRQQQHRSSSIAAVLLAMAAGLVLALLPIVVVTMSGSSSGERPTALSMPLHRAVSSLCGTGGGAALLVLDCCLLAWQLGVLHRTGFVSLGLSGLSRITYFWVFQYISNNRNRSGGGGAVADETRRLPTSVGQEETLRLFTRNWNRLSQTERNRDKPNGDSGSGAVLAKAIVRTFAKDLCVSSVLQLAVYASQLAIPVLVAQMLSHLSQTDRSGGEEERLGAFGGSAAHSTTTIGNSDSAGAAIRTLVLYSAALLMAAVVEQNQIDLCDRLALKIHITLAASVHRSMLETPGRALGSGAASENPSAVVVYTAGVEHTKALGKHIVKLCGDVWLPLRVVGGLWMFYSQVGWAIFPGISFILLYLPLRRTFLQQRTREQAMAGAATATRVSLLTRLIDNIVPLRLLNWDTLVAERIQQLRETDELCARSSVSLANSLLSLARTACRSCGPIVSLFVYSAGILYFSGQDGRSGGRPQEGGRGAAAGWVSVEQVYVVQAVLRELFPLVIDVPHAFDGWWAAKLPYSHVSRALSRSTSRGSSRRRSLDKTAGGGDGGMAVCIRNQSYAWTAAAEASASGLSAQLRFALRDVSVSASAGQLICIVGKVGSGKSSLLSAILGEMPQRVVDGSSLSTTAAYEATRSSTSHAYVPQTAWLMEGTIRDNITLGAGYDSAWFGRVVEACELAHDIEHQWPLRDLTVVGANGSTVSGGQRMRIALARAVYSRISSAVYLLDDVLAMVDAQVARRIIDNVLCGPTALLHGTTRIVVVDNSHALLASADAVWVVGEGAVRAMRPSAYFLSSHYVPSEPLHEDCGPAGGESPALPLATPPASICSAAPLSPEQAEPKEEEEEEGHGAQLHRDNRPASAASGSAGGAGHLEPVRYLVRLCGWAPVVMHITTVALQCVASRNAQLWLAKQIPIFSTDNSTRSMGSMDDTSAADTRPPMLHRHFVLCVVWWAGDILLEFASQLWTDVVWQRSMFVKSHRQLLRSVVDAPLRFFQPSASSGEGGNGGPPSAATGRVLELFTASQADIDTHLPRQVAGVATFAVKLVFEAWVVLAFHPALVATTLVAATAMWAIMRATRRPLARLIAEIGAAAPAIDHQFHESAAGAAVFRAFGQTAYADRKLLAALGSYARAQRAQDCVETWIDLAMALLRESANIVAFGVALLATTSQRTRASDSGARAEMAAVDPAQMSLVTLCVTFLLARLQHLVRHSHALRTSLARACRYIGFTRLESERTRNHRALAALRDPPNRIAAAANSGDIVFDRVFAAYASGGAWALANMSFRLAPGQHVGIVGRTGAGKSSIAMALFGLLELSSGSITVGGRDIRDFGDPRALRAQLGIVPQDPLTLPAVSASHRCAATVRENLDPLRRCATRDLESALCAAGLQRRLLDESPDAWSVGQKQKLALARVLLRAQTSTPASSSLEPPISVVVLDEATAHIDSRESAALLRALRRRLDPRCIVVTVAHRIDAVMACHRVLVVGDGCVCEAGAPRDLLAREDSLFARLARLDRPVDPASCGRRATADAGPPTPPHENADD